MKDNRSAPRAEALFRSDLRRTHVATDRMFAVLMLVQWVAGILAAALIAPKTWIGATSATHVHVWTAVFLGAAIASLPITLVVLRPGRSSTRLVIAVAQPLFSALLIHLSGGRIETHFHVFGSLAFLAFYRDWRVLAVATTVVAADHMWRGIYWPQSVFGVLTAGSWRWAEHVAWVLFEDVILFESCRRGLREMRSLATRQAALETSKADVELQVEARTAELCAAQRAAEDASRTKSLFLANMSHEIRTPMTAILGFTDVLLDPEATASDRDNSAHTIRRNGGHLLHLINDILDMSKIEAGRLEVDVRPTPIGQLLAEAVEFVGHRAEAKGILVSIEVDGAIPGVIQTDPYRLKQALVNLLGNAVKFTDSGPEPGVVRLVASCTPEDETIVFRVVDHGIGMTGEQTARLFRPFVQADRSTTRKFGGTGLGLTISREIGRLLGGDLDVTSTMGAGSTFTLAVSTGPLAGVAMVSDLGIISAPACESVALEALPTIDGRVLVVEDGIDNQRLIAFLLKRAGARIAITSNGREGFDEALRAWNAAEPYDVVLMDLQMPEMDGYEATRSLRDAGYPGTIVALTAHTMKGEIDRCLGNGFDGYLGKPIDRAVLITEVARLVRDARGRRDGSLRRSA